MWILEVMPWLPDFIMLYCVARQMGLYSTFLSHLLPWFPSFPLFSTYSHKLLTSPSSFFCLYHQLLKICSRQDGISWQQSGNNTVYRAQTQNLAIQSVSWVCTPCPWTVVAMPLQLAMPASTIKQGMWRCSLLCSQQLCLQRVKNVQGFSALISWSFLIIVSAPWLISLHWRKLPLFMHSDLQRPNSWMQRTSIQKSMFALKVKENDQSNNLSPSCPFCFEKARKSHILSHIANNSPLTSNRAKIVISTDLF